MVSTFRPWVNGNPLGFQAVLLLPAVLALQRRGQLVELVEWTGPAAIHGRRAVPHGPSRPSGGRFALSPPPGSARSRGSLPAPTAVSCGDRLAGLGIGSLIGPVRIGRSDLGKTSLSYAVGSVGEDGRLALEHSGVLPHEGQPLALFARWYREHSIGRCDALGATGVYSSELPRPVVGLPEDGCQEAALGWAGAPPSLNLVSVGGRGYSVLTRRPEATDPAARPLRPGCLPTSPSPSSR